MNVPVFTDLRKIEFKDKPKPEAGEGEVLVKVEYCGICGSDVHGYLNGIMVPLGTVMGHECSGTVAEVGRGVPDWHPGERVVVKPIAQCNECYQCGKGQYSLCGKAFERAIGISPNHDGAYAEYVKVEYPKEMLFKLPENVSFQHGALVEPLSTSLHGVRMSSLRPGDKAVVIGAGMIGLGVIQFLKLAGAGEIIVLDISAKKAQMAREMGADVTLDPSVEGQGLRDRIFGLTGGVGADVVYECSGVAFGFQNAMYFAKAGGQVMVVGICDKEVPFNPFMQVLWEIEMKGVLGYYDEFNYVIEFLRRGKINADALISDVIPLKDLAEKGFNRLLANKDEIKILVRPRGDC
jgi:(R,R)-butanediol dehydrogenase / meso-butanediol dehydrogenase / diacetyl reductase